MPLENLLPPHDIPDLSRLKPWSEWATVLRGIARGGSKDHTTHVLLINAIRLSDAAIDDYALGRSHILAFHSRDPSQFAIGHIMRAASHFETCIWHLERFIKHARAIRSHPNVEPEIRNLVPRTLKILQGGTEAAITRLRHTLAHLERFALRGELPPGTKNTLLPLESGLHIGKHSIEWLQLAEWLEECNKVTEALANYRQP